MVDRGWYPGPARGWCGYKGSTTTDCDGFQTHSDVLGNREPYGDKRPFPEDRIDALKGDSWPAKDLIDQLLGRYSPTQKYCPSIDHPRPGVPSKTGTVVPTSTNNDNPGMTSRGLSLGI